MKESSWLAELWFSPGWVFMKYVHLLRQIGMNEERIRSEGRFKKVREALAAANLALAVQTYTNQPVYVQLSPDDPPDFFLFQASPDDPTTPWITYVEHTTFGAHPSQTDIGEQLKKTKLAVTHDDAHDYALVVEVEELQDEDIAAVAEAITETDTTYKVWLLRGRMEDDDELITVVAFNSPFEVVRADAKAESERFADSDAAFIIKRSEKDTKEPPPGQPAPWPDPLT